MKKVLIFILFLFSCSFAINSFTYPWIINLTGDTATVVKWKGNNDTVKAFCDRAADTISFHSRQIDSVQSLYTPWSLFSNHDSTFKWMRIDTVFAESIYVSGGVTVAGNFKSGTYQDSVSAAEFGRLNGVTSPLQGQLALKFNRASFDSAFNANMGDDGVLQKPSGNKLVNSIISDKGKATVAGRAIITTGSSGGDTSNADDILILESNGNTFLDILGTSTAEGIIISNSSRRAVAAISYRNQYDSLQIYVNGDKAIGVDSNQNVTLHKDLKVVGKAKADSLTLTKGIMATIGRFTNIFGTTGTFSGAVNADSLHTTKGIMATIGRFTGAIFGASATISGAVSADSINARAVGVEYNGVCTLQVASGTLTGDSIGVCKIVKTGNVYTGYIWGINATASTPNSQFYIKPASSLKGLLTGASSAPGGAASGTAVPLLGQTTGLSFASCTGAWIKSAPGQMLFATNTAVTELLLYVSFSWVH